MFSQSLGNQKYSLLKVLNLEDIRMSTLRIVLFKLFWEAEFFIFAGFNFIDIHCMKYARIRVFSDLYYPV